MGTPAVNSVIGNVTATRQRLSGIRQRIGLEPSPQTMRQLAPSPANGPADAPGAAMQAVAQGIPAQQPQAAPGQAGGGDDRRGAMLQKVQQFLDQVGPQQQQMIDQERQAANPQQAIPANSVHAKALAPMADFFRQNGRLPNIEELRALSATRMLAEQIGRKPSDTELQLFMSKPPKFGGSS